MPAKLPASLQKQQERYEQHRTEVENRQKGEVERPAEMTAGKQPAPDPEREGQPPEQTKGPQTDQLGRPLDENGQPKEPERHQQKGGEATSEELAKISHRLKTLEGMYRSEKTKRETLAEENAELKRTLEEKPKAESRPDAIQLEDFFSQDDIELYGRDYLLKQLQANAKLFDLSPLQEKIERLEREIKPLKRTAETSQQDAMSVRQERFWEQLEEKVSDWQQIDTDPGFSEYLDGVHPETGLPRRAHLTDAYEKLDAARVVAVMKGYKASVRRSDPDPNRYVHPESVPSGGAPPDKPVYSTKDYLKFMADYRKGRFKGSEEWAEQRRKELEAAYRENRVR